ncbi:hypothetical protein M0R45_008953 [Rubus argutus]|uniref:Uncharacterized protein n=1 Tax=Rubus argutus TaxID=59490 RepID=A0AAW1Y2M4_RUBAR
MALKFLNKKEHGEHPEHRERVEGRAEARRRREEVGRAPQTDRRRKRTRRVPKQERLEFLYDSGLAVGRPGGSDNFKDAFPKTEEPPSSSTAAAKEGSSSSVPGALFAADKPQSANDAWRKLHSDPLLMIKQREQEALSRIKNNPVQMAMIRKQLQYGFSAMS